MTITIFRGFSKEINSTKRPSGGSVVSCVLKGDVNIMSPVFELDTTDTTINYVIWDNRYYFVDDITFVRASTILLHCKIDSLATVKADIGASEQYVTRATSDFDSTVIDTRYPMLPETLSQNITFDSIHTKFSGSTYVIGVIGSNSVNGVTFYALTSSQFASLLNALFLGNYLDAPVTEISKELQKELVNPFQYIVSAMWFPFTIATDFNQSIKFGFWDTEVSAGVISDNRKYVNALETFDIPTHPQLNVYGRFLGCNPYTQLLLHCYSFGDLVIPANMFSMGAQRGELFLNVDVYTGVGELRVYTKQFNTGNDNNVVCRSVAQIGVPIQLSQVTQGLIQSAVGIVGSVGALAQGNFIGVLSGIGDAVSGLLPQVEKSGAYGSRIAFLEPPTMYITQYGLASPDHAHLGRPLMQRRVLNTLSGFIQVENPDVDIAYPLAIREEVISYMQSGFYYE